MPTVVHAPSAALAATLTPTLTVEAEYGSVVAEGSRYTAAHHQATGPFAGRHIVAGGRPSPCNDPAIPSVHGDEVVLISHLDLDTVGGVLRATLGQGHPIFRHTGFWELAEFLDVSGAHKLAAADADSDDIRAIYAWWAWAKTGLPRFPRDAVADATAAIDAAGAVLNRILVDLDSGLLLAGDAFRADEAALNARTFVRRDGDVLVRRAEVGGDFCNHLYVDPTGASARAVVCLNTAYRSVTVSLADPDKETVSCRELVQGLWGPEAGGHKGIGGGPREVAFDETHLEAAVYAMVAGLTS
jgi:hypothetical protein